MNRPKEHRKINFVVSSVHSYSIKCFDVYLQIDIADKEYIAFSGCQTFQNFFNIFKEYLQPTLVWVSLYQIEYMVLYRRDNYNRRSWTSPWNLATILIRQYLWVTFAAIFKSFWLQTDKNAISFLCSASVPEKLRINRWFLSFLNRSFQIRRKRWIVSTLPSDIGTMILTFLIGLDLFNCNGLLRIWIWFEVKGTSIGIASRNWGWSKRNVEMNCLTPRKFSGFWDTGWPFWTKLNIVLNCDRRPFVPPGLV